MQQPDGEGAGHDQLAMSKVNYPHDAENKHQADSKQCKEPALDEAVYD